MPKLRRLACRLLGHKQLVFPTRTIEGTLIRARACQRCFHVFALDPIVSRRARRAVRFGRAG
jgi:hypothetical protein